MHVHLPNAGSGIEMVGFFHEREISLFHAWACFVAYGGHCTLGLSFEAPGMKEIGRCNNGGICGLL